MAKITATIMASNLKSDGTWMVIIRIWHNGNPAYLDTEYHVSKKQVAKKDPKKDNSPLVIKDRFTLDLIEPRMIKYRAWIHANIHFVDKLSAKELKARLLASDSEKILDKIDFLEFCNTFIEQKLNSSKASSERTLVTVRNSLKDYFDSPYIPITEINFNFLKKYELYLRSERELTRNNNGSEMRTYSQKGLSDSGLHNHMRDLRLLFNESRNQYNDEDLGIIRIPHYPFKKYKVGTPPITKHRDRPAEPIEKARQSF